MRLCALSVGHGRDLLARMSENRSLSDFTDEELATELKRRKSGTAGRRKTRRSMQSMELEAARAAKTLEHEALTQMLAELGEEDGSPKACPKCGKPTPVKGKARKRTLRTLSGKVTLTRNYHHCRECKFGFYPRDIELELPEKGAVSSELEKRLLDMAIHSPFGQGPKRWSVHYLESISDNLLRRVTDRVGLQCEKTSDTALQSSVLPSPEPTPTEVLMVQSDGSQLPTRDENWKEAKLAVLVRDEHHLSHRESKRGAVTQARYVAVLGQQQEFFEALKPALRAEKWRHAKEVVWIGDGAPGNWTLASRLAPGATQILDWYHALENGNTCGKVLLGENDVSLPLWQARIAQLLHAGAIDKLIAELLGCLDMASSPVPIASLVGYYRNNRQRMQYPDYRARGLPIGSGIVESGHKHVLQDRMKRAGQRWSLIRGRRMVRMRAVLATVGADKFHRTLRRAFSKSWGQPVYVKNSQPRRRASNL